MTIADVAVLRFEQHYSCAQASFSALAERFGIAPELAYRIAAGYGGGIARSAKTCGCVTGAVMALGLAQTAVIPGETNNVEKEKTYEVVRRLLKEVAARHGSTECVELLGCHIGTPEGMQYARNNNLFRTKCPLILRDVIEITDRLLEERGFPAAGAAAK